MSNCAGQQICRRLDSGVRRAEWAFAHAPVSVFLEYDYLGTRSADVPLISAIVPGLVFPINVSQKVHTVLFGMSPFRERTLRFQKG